VSFLWEEASFNAYIQAGWRELHSYFALGGYVRRLHDWI
jgi:hypothetical protein